MAKVNCWEFKSCGREPGGPRVGELGACPAAADVAYSGVHGGINGGRCCWGVAGTFCGGTVQGTFAQKLATCVGCEFFLRVNAEEDDVKSASEIVQVKTRAS